MTIRKIASIVLGALLVTACGSTSGSSGTSQTGSPSDAGTTPPAERFELAVGSLPNAYNAPFYVGMKQGFFEEEGLNITVNSYQGFQPEIAAALNGEIQVGYTAMAPMVVAISQDVPIRIIAAADTAGDPKSSDPGAEALVVPAGVKPPQWKDLDGETIALNSLGGIQQLAIMAAVDNAGGDSKSLKFIQVPFAEALPALKDGRVKIAALAEPFLTPALAQGMQPMGYYLKEGTPDLPVTGYFATQKFIDSNPEIVKAFVRAMNKSTDYASENPDLAREVIPTYTRIDTEAAAKITLPEFDSTFASAKLSSVNELLVKYGMAERQVDAQRLVFP